MDSNHKGEIGITKAVADLTVKGFVVFTPVGERRLPVDLIAYDSSNQRIIRFQAKYSVSGLINDRIHWYDSSGSHYKKYDDNDFDYYAVFLPNVDKVIYPSIKFGGCTIATEPRKSFNKFYWYEDFLNFTDNATKRSYKDFNLTITHTQPTKGRKYPERYKVQRPTCEELSKLLWEIPTTHIAARYGVSDKAISKWAKDYQIEKPPRGYWRRKVTGKL